MPNKFYAIDPAGATHKRVSASRTYTHTVVYLPNYDKELENANSPEYAESDKGTYAYHVLRATGEYRWDWMKPGETLPITSEDKEIYSMTSVEYISKKLAERIASVEAKKANGYYETYINAGWNGRRDLSVKLAADVSSRAWAKNLNVTILEAIPGESPV